MLQSIEVFVTQKLAVLLKGDFSDLAAVRVHKHYLESVVFSLLNAKHIFGETGLRPRAVLHRLAVLNLLSPGVDRFFEENEAVLAADVQKLTADGCEHIAILYETLLQRDFEVTGDNAAYRAGKVTRDTTGSYYTPPELAVETVRHACEVYGSGGGAKASDVCRYADFSCGCGEFFQALLQVLGGAEGRSGLCLRFWGADIDPIALQITVCSLLPHVEEARWPELIAHFFLGNPLIVTDAEASRAEKTDLFAQGRYYAAPMGFAADTPLFTVKYDVVVGNPPWEKVRFEERKFFRPICPDISAISQKEKRSKAISALRESRPAVHASYTALAEDYRAYSRLAQKHPLLRDSLHGELNTYALFTELAMKCLDTGGVVTLIVKSSLVTMPTQGELFRVLAEGMHLVSIALFDNTKRLFSIDSREKFCVLTAGEGSYPQMTVAAGLTESGQLRSAHGVPLDYAALKKLNPSTGMIPNVSSTEAVNILVRAHAALPVFEEVYPDCHFGRIVHLTTHAGSIDTQPAAGNLPIYEGKFIYQYDARYSTFAGMEPEQMYSPKASARIQHCGGGAKPAPVSRYFIDASFWETLRKNYPEPFSLCWRSLTSTTNFRTMIAMILPTVPACQSVQLLQTADPETLLYLLGLFNSKCFDAFVRLKMPGIDLTQSVIRQIPVPPPDMLEQTVSLDGQTAPLRRHILWRVASLLNAEPLTKPLAVRYVGTERAYPDAQKELDELFTRAYALSQEELKMLSECSGIQF